jgi:FdhE protein
MTVRTRDDNASSGQQYGQREYLTKEATMDLTLIDQAIKAYQPLLNENDRKRLEFFRGLWELQQGYISQMQSTLNYELPESEQVLSWYWDEKPLFLMAPLTIDKELFLSALSDCTTYIADNAGLSEEAVSTLRAFDWSKLIESVGLEQAGYDPGLWLSVAFAAAVEQVHSETTAQAQQGNAQDTGALGIVLNCALRPMLEPAAKQAMTLYAPDRESYENHTKPLRCPVCGGHAGLCYVGNTPSSEGAGHMLYCTTCSANWEFERIRCAHCGTQNQSKLHYFHVEDDTAHRLYLCDECSSYLRTTFLSDLKAPFCMEVEDVVMAKLDHVANHAHIRPNRKDS